MKAKEQIAHPIGYITRSFKYMSKLGRVRSINSGEEVIKKMTVSIWDELSEFEKIKWRNGTLRMSELQKSNRDAWELMMMVKEERNLVDCLLEIPSWVDLPEPCHN
jgi:hypothetical protein